MTNTRENALISKINTQLTEYFFLRANAECIKMRRDEVREEYEMTGSNHQSGQKITNCETKIAIKPKDK